ncbi:MAG: hypothetical protein OEV66_09660 [Spirochaetia bacterium]|nr:hypothetical protein [Spirochaetia bacterium]
MHNITAAFEVHRSEIMTNWLLLVFPELASKKNGANFQESLVFKETMKDFTEILDYVFSGNPESSTEETPVARTLIKLNTLNEKKSAAKDSGHVIYYSLHLRTSLIPYITAEQKNGMEILLATDTVINRLLMAAFDFYLKTREKIYTIKIAELERGVLAGETQGCPSGHVTFENSKGARF